MPDLAGNVADAFAERIRELEEESLSPLAVRSYDTRGRRSSATATGSCIRSRFAA
jgi:hypothetical protein